MSDEVDSGTSEGIPTAIEDPDGYVKARRLRTIQDRIDDIGEVKRVVRAEASSGNMTDEEARKSYRAAIERALMEMENAANRDSAPETVTKLWHSTPLGEFEVPPPDDPPEIPNGATAEWSPPRVTLDVESLSDLLTNYPTDMVVSFEATYYSRNVPQQQETVDKPVEMPWDILKSAERRLRTVAFELDMGVGETSKKRVHSSTSYSHHRPGGVDGE